MMPQKTRVVGLDVAKGKIDACIRSASLRLSKPSTREGEAQLVAWLRANRVGLAVMEASGGYERSWAEVLRAAGVVVRIVDPKRIRCFAKAAGRLAKNDPIDAETIAWFAETFPDAEAQANDPARAEVDRLVQARAAVREVKERIAQQGEHEGASDRRQGACRDRQDSARRAAQTRRRDRRQDQGQPDLRTSGRDHRERAGARRSGDRRRDRLVSRARACQQ
jgi:hypothetical protein